MKTIFTPEPTTVNIRLSDSRYVIFSPRGQRVDSKHTRLAAEKTAKRLFPNSKIDVDV